MSSKIKEKLLRIPVFFEKVEEVSDNGIDNRFTKVKIFLMHLGENFNGSIFEKEVVDEAIPTLGYIPIVAFIEKNRAGELDCSDHRYVIVKDKNGIREEYRGSAYGVVTSSEDNDAHYEERLCDDGETRTFLVVNGLLWNMFDTGASDIMRRDIIKGQSMELFTDEDSIDGYEDENGIFHFTKFSFRAACILGDDFEPAMINSTVEVMFTMNDFVKSLHRELNDKYTTFTKIVNEKKTNQGGIETMPNTEMNTDFAQTVLEQFNDISTMVMNQESCVDRWGDKYPRYYAVDIQDNEVIVVDRNANYHYFGFPFTMNGDKAEIDFTCGKRKKLCYADYVDGETAPDDSFSFGKHIDEIEQKAFEKLSESDTKLNEALTDKNTAKTEYTKVKAELDGIKAEYDEIKPKYDTYVAEDTARKNAELETKKNAEFAKYEFAIGECSDFIELKNKKDELTIDEIKTQCAIMYARETLENRVQFSKNNMSGSGDVTAGVTNDEENNDDGYLHTKYGRISITR